MMSPPKTTMATCAMVTLLFILQTTLISSSSSSSSLLTTTTGRRQLAASPCPNDPSIVGYSTWSALSTDIQFNNNGDVFVLCPSTTFTSPGQSLLIEDAGTVVSCGPYDPNDVDGRFSANSCSIRGARTLSLQSSSMLFRGITFEEQDGEIFIGIGSNPNVIFQYCNFRNTLFPGGSFRDNLVRVFDGVVSFSDCIFEDNQGAGVVSIWEGTGTFERCQFRRNLANNRRTTASAIVAGVYESAVSSPFYRTAQLFISNCCFEDNTGDSVVYVNPGSSVLLDSDNAGDDNNSASCNGIFFNVQPGDEDNPAPVCNTFAATVCPTNSPTSSPTFPPTNTPTTPNPTNVPSKSPTASPSTSPTNKPTNIPSNSPTTTSPTTSPSYNPTTSHFPTRQPTNLPTLVPSSGPPIASASPTATNLTVAPTTMMPTTRISSSTTAVPTSRPPTAQPPSEQPSFASVPTTSSSSATIGGGPQQQLVVSFFISAVTSVVVVVVVMTILAF